jgi:DnaJ family protein C protein 9
VEGDEQVKKESTTKFQVLGRVYAVLGSSEKKRLYDECGIIEGEDDVSVLSSNVKDWEKYWRMLFKKVSKEDIDSFFKTYKNSAEERADLIKFYEKHRGDMDLIMQEVFSEDNSIETEQRFKKIIMDAIGKGEIKAYDKLVKEDPKKAAKRKAVNDKEADEAKEARKQLRLDKQRSEADLINTLISKREVDSASFIQYMIEKYGDENTPAKKRADKKKTQAPAKGGRRAAAIDIAGSEEMSDDEPVSVEDSDDESEEKGLPTRASLRVVKKPKKRASAAARLSGCRTPARKVTRRFL